LVQKVDFFVSGVLINTQTTPVSGTSNVYRTTYALPAAGAYTITARVTNSFGQTADNSVTVIAGSPEPGTNAAFIFDMYQLLLYRLPTDEEYETASIYLEEASSGGVLAPLSVRAQWVMSLMGYSNPTPSSPATGIFNYKSNYQLTSGFAIQPYGRLGLTPNAARVESFLEAMQADLRLLPFPGTEYASIPGAPYGATYGMAAAIQAIFDGTAFQSANPGVTSLNNGNFVFWLQTNMFDTNTGTGVEVVTMMNSISPQLIRQGAAAAFLTKFTLECASIGVQGWQPEKDFQLKVNAAALKFQLNESNSAFWDFAGAPFYTQMIVEQYLQQYWDNVQQSP
jgi:hypothetical protein